MTTTPTDHQRQRFRDWWAENKADSYTRDEELVCRAAAWLAWQAAALSGDRAEPADSGHSVGAFSGDAAAQQTEKGASCFDNGCAGCEQCTDYE